MTTDTDPNTRTSGETRQPCGDPPARTAKSPEIHIKMPDQGAPDARGNGTPAGGGPAESTERLLLKLMARLDENDRHYGKALDNLNDRLNTLSQRADAASTAVPGGSTEALDRLREQASSLAAQVNDAGAAHRAQQPKPNCDTALQPGTLSSPLELDDSDGPDTAVNDDFATVTRRLERSLEEGAPAATFQTLSNRMEELACHLDTALESRNAASRLQAIEARLEELARGFTNAQRHYSRIEDIEGHLMRLMNWAQSADAPVNNSNMCSRLEAIENALQALNERAAKTESAGQSQMPAAANAEHRIDTRKPYLPVEPARQDITADNAGPALEDRPENKADSGPAAPVEPHGPDRRSGVIDRRTQSPGRIEPAFEPDNDFVASARRAAEAAEKQAPASGRADATGPIEKLKPVKTSSSDSKRPRALFVAAAAGLLLVSSGILLGQLNTKPEAPTAIPAGKKAAQPAQQPNPAAAKEKKKSSLRAPGGEKKKLHSGRMPPGQPDPASAKPASPATPTRAATVTPAKYDPSAPARVNQLTILPKQTVSTATLLASLSQEATPGRESEIQVTIKEPAAPTPARAAPVQIARTTPPAVSPALVPPPVFASRPNPLAQPKRAPLARQAMPPRATAMPPLRIGPLSLRMAAARGNPEAQVEVATRFAKGTGVAKNLKSAAEWFNRAAAQGFAPAQYNLAALHERGLGVKKDIALARSWYRRAAELGNIRAMHNLAVLHTRSETGSPDYTGAMNWFREAARHGLADSQFNLGILYERGLGAAKNAAEAYKWFTLAARQGDGEASKRGEAIRPKLPARSLRAVKKTLQQWKPVTPGEEANRTGQPRGGWQNAARPETATGTGSAIVARAQKLLNKLGYNAGPSDGKLGPQTITAIGKFETRAGLPQTGKVTPNLMQQLDALSS